MKKVSTPAYICIFLLCIILSLVVIFYQNKAVENGKSNIGENIFSSAALPLQGIINNFVRGVSSFFSSFKASKDLMEENYRLKDEISKLKKENDTLKETSEQNKKLKELLDIKNELKTETLTAEVIGREPNSWFQSITIEKGNKDGIKKDMIVMNNEGLVGRVTVVSEYTSKVMLITDTSSAVPALIRETRDAGIIYGTGNICEMRYININSQIKPGYTVVSSGLGNIFPKGFVIGKVITIHPSADKLFQAAEIEPAVKSECLENLLIIIKSDPTEEIFPSSKEGI